MAASTAALFRSSHMADMASSTTCCPGPLHSCRDGHKQSSAVTGMQGYKHAPANGTVSGSARLWLYVVSQEHPYN